MAARLTKKNSAFLAFQQAELDFDSDGSDEERALQEQKEKQKAKKKSSKKKKSSENSLLKELAMCSVSTSKKKPKGKAQQSPPTEQPSTEAAPEPAATTKPSSPVKAAPPLSFATVAQKAASAPMVAETAPPAPKAAPVAAAQKATPTNSHGAAHTSAPSKCPTPQPSVARSVPPRGSSPRPSISVSTVRQSTQTDLIPAARANAPPPSAPTPAVKAAPPSKSVPSTHAPSTPEPKGVSKSPQQRHSPAADCSTSQHQNGQNDMGAIYSPTHITVTRADGQVSRQIAVAEMMDQLVRFQQHNAQLTLANRSLQEDLQRGAAMINSLQNEVAMFRQMCLSLQGEVTQLRALTTNQLNVTTPPVPGAPVMNGQPPYGRGARPAPPPGML